MVEQGLKQYAWLFDSVESRPLTAEQRNAAVIMPQRQLLLAAAGSGKTSTIVGKVVYALASGQFKAEEILVLAFNTKAANELEVRIQQALRRSGLSGSGVPTCNITASTMHALGLQIAGRSQGCPPAVLSASQQEKFIYSTIESLIRSDIHFAAQWLLFRVFYHHKVLHPGQLKGRGQWRSFVAKHGSRVNRHYGFLTLRTELAATQFEQAVANWLYLLGINYEYRTGLVHRLRLGAVPGTAAGLLQGHTCFILPDLNLKVYCVATANTSPKQGCVYLLLDDFIRGLTFEQLLQLPIVPNVALVAARLKKMVTKIGYVITAAQSSLLLDFIRSLRLAGSVGAYPACAASNNRVQMHTGMLLRLANAYEQALSRGNKIDFEGMLVKSAQCLEQQKYKHAYRLILVDEFQDTSMAGVRLLQALLDQNKQCKLFAVGDDWQSIYGFAGAVPDVMRNFDNYFGKHVTTSLTATFRFSQRIADTASKFIQANPMQLKKQVRANRAGSADCIKLHMYTTAQHMYALCYLCLQEIAQSLTDLNRTFSVFILGRYQHQKPSQLSVWHKQFTSLNISFHTVHASKGLEADAVIILGLQGGHYGFPGQIQSDALISMVRPGADTYPHAEERRAFYVALTRTRGSLYLLAGVKSQSEFVQELLLSIY